MQHNSARVEEIKLCFFSALPKLLLRVSAISDPTAGEAESPKIG
jgi:hypothetical protein